MHTLVLRLEQIPFQFVVSWYGKNKSTAKILKEHDALITCLEFSYEGDCFVSDIYIAINMWWLVNCAVDAIKVTMERQCREGDILTYS